MDGRALTEHYFSTLPEIEKELRLPLLGRLDAEPRFYQLQEMLASLAPDPRFAERLYRLIDRHPPRIWVAGLGDAGEEIPVAVGIAEQAAGEGAGTVLLVRLQDSVPDTVRRSVLRPVIAAGLDRRLGLLFPGGCAAMPSGIQGVFRAYEASAAGGEPIAPDSLVVAGGTQDEERWPAREIVDGVVLVVPFRDQSRERIAVRATALREAGYEIAGFVAFGPAGTAAGRWDGEEADDSAEGTEPDTPDSVSSEASLIGESDKSSAAARQRLDSAPPAPAGETPELSDDETGASSPPPDERETERSGQSDARIPVSRSWSDTYGPRRRGLFSHGGARGSRGFRPWIPIVLVLALLAIVVIIGRQKGWDLPLIGGSQSGGETVTQMRPAEVAPIPPAADAAAAEEAMATAEVEQPSGGEASESQANSAPVSGVADAEGAVVMEGAATAARTEPVAEMRRVSETSPEPIGEVTPPVVAVRDMVRSYEGPYAVLCGSFRSEANAAGLVKRLHEQKLAARVQAVRIPDRGIWHRVVIGGGAEREAAEQLAQRVVSAGSVVEAQVVAQNGWGRGVPHPIRHDADTEG